MSYSKDLKSRVLEYVGAGGSKASAARLYNVHVSTIYLWLKAGSERPRVKPGPKGPRKVSYQQISRAIEAQPDRMLKELAADLRVHESTVSRALKKLGLSRKKNVGVRGALSAKAKDLSEAMV